jgi:hypothetical protein
MSGEKHYMYQISGLSGTARASWLWLVLKKHKKSAIAWLACSH